MNKILIGIYLSIIAIFSGIVFSTQVLAFSNLFYPIPFFIFSIIICIFLGIVLRKYVYGFILNTIENFEKIQIRKSFRIIAFVTAIIFFLIVLFLPLILWPYSGINHELTWDAGVYHFPKATTMILSNSAWDLSIAYGEYPFGYESLIAASLLISPSGYFIGIVHGLILLFFVLTLYFLVNRFSRLPSEYLLFIVIFLTASFDLLPTFDSNPFSMIRIIAFTIGKNDFLLTSLILAFSLFSPIKKSIEDYSPIGLCLISFMIACTKPNGFLVLGFIWGLLLIMDIWNWIKLQKISLADIKKWIGIVLLHLCGLLWVIRNFIVQGKLFSQDSLLLEKQSILLNLKNPVLTQSIDLNLKIVIILLVCIVILSFFSRRIDWKTPVFFVILLLSFLLTPATFVFEAGHSKAFLNWRFGLYLLAFEIPLLFLLFDIFLPITTKVQPKIKLLANILILAIMGGIFTWGCIKTHLRLVLDPANTIVLKDQYREKVGVDGYFSVYDYIQKNVHNSIVWVENGMPYYVVGNPITNSVTRSNPADYLVVIQTNWNGNHDDQIDMVQPALDQWQQVYADPEGIVYKRSK